MFNGAFEKLDLPDIVNILEHVNPLIKDMEFDPVETAIMATNISFYPGYRYLEIKGKNGHSSERTRFVIYAPNDAHVLNYTNEPIYALNKAVPLNLNETNAAEYIKFFFNHVKGRHGRFLICENVDDIHWREEPPLPARKAIGRMLKPMSRFSKTQDGSFKTEATMMFKDSLFKSTVTVNLQGFVNLTDEELLVEDVPVIDDILE